MPHRTASPALTVEPLAPEAADAAFLLAREAHPGLPVERWRAFLRAWRETSGARGVLGARNQRNTLLGFAAWWQQPDLEFGEALWASPVFAHEPGRRPLVRRALEAALAQLAASLGARLRLVAAPPSEVDVANDACE